MLVRCRGFVKNIIKKLKKSYGEKLLQSIVFSRRERERGFLFLVELVDKWNQKSRIK